MKRALGVLVALVSLTAAAKPVQKPVVYELERNEVRGRAGLRRCREGGASGAGGGPNWMGINAPNLKQAAQIAGKQYILFVTDMYGQACGPRARRRRARPRAR